MTTEDAATAAKENPVLGGFDAEAGEKPVESGVDKGAEAAKPDAGKEKAAPDAAEAGKEEPKAVEAPKEEPKPDVAQNAALDEARSELRELRGKISDLESRPTLSKEQQAALDKLKEAEQATKEAEPDFLADPKGYVDAKVKAALDKLEGSEKQSKEESEKIKAQQALSNLMSAVGRAEAVFAESTPDYSKALTHVRDVRKQQLKMIYPDATDQQIGGQLAQEEIAIAHQVLARNENPAEFLYNLSKTYGYKPPEPHAKEKPLEVESPKPKEAKKADKEAARSMGSGGGDLPDNEDSGPNTPELAAALSERFKKRA